MADSGDSTNHNDKIAPEPFRIKASDPFACAIIRLWIVVARNAGVSHEKLTDAEKHFHEIKTWQLQNGYKLPD